MSVERELKLSAPPAFAMPDLGPAPDVAVAPGGTLRYRTVYVDTDDLRLARWGCSLRHREGEGWTLKLPSTRDGALLVRAERRFEGSPRRVPPSAAELLTAYVRGAELRPVVRLRTVRRVLALRDGTGAAAGEVVDDEVSVIEGPRVAARFRELEIEVTEGFPRGTLAWLVGTLRAAGASPTDGSPKYVRALGSRAAEPPEVVVPELAPDASVVEVVRAAIASSVLRLIRHDPGVRLGEDPEDVHQARVATRRLRSDLRTFREVLDPDLGVSLREELGWLGRELGAVRDLDVQLERLRGRVAPLPPEDRPVAERLVGELEARRAESRERLLTAMRSGRYVGLLDRLVDAAREPAVPPAVAPVPAAMALGGVMDRPWKHLRAALDALAPDAPDADLHAARIRTKRARYAAEAVAPVFGRRASAFARAAAELQDVLGEHQDAVVALAWLRRAATGPRRAFVAGEIAAIEAQAARAARGRVRAAWRILSRKRLRFWP